MVGGSRDDFCPSCGQTLPNYNEPMLVGDWRIEYPNKILYKGESIRTSPQQFNVFEKIVRNHLIHRRDTTYKELWIYLYPEGEATENTVKVLLHQLRGKLPIKCIEVIWATGIVFHPYGIVEASTAPTTRVINRRKKWRYRDVIDVRSPKDDGQ